MKLTKNNIKKADRIIKVKSISELTIDGFRNGLIRAMVDEHGFYGYTDKSNGNVKVLVVTNECYNKAI